MGVCINAGNEISLKLGFGEGVADTGGLETATEASVF